MCVIITLAPGAMMNREEFFNAVYNNWHGYGLVLKDGNGHLQLMKGYDPEGTKPEELYKLLEDNKDVFRFLHVRHSTKGATDETNVQPFPVYSSDTRTIYFMHNGTLYNFGESGGVGKSDTLCFAEQILQPALLSWTGPNGKGDYTDPNFTKLIVDKQWSSSSTGLFVSNDLQMLRYGSGWSLYKHPVGAEDSVGEIYVSNTSYFQKVTRGPRFQQLEAERKAREAREAEALAESRKTYAAHGNQGGQSSVASSGFCDDMDEWGQHYSGPNGKQSHTVVRKFNSGEAAKDPAIIRAMNDVIDSFDLMDPNKLVTLSKLSYEDWLQWLEEDVQYGQWNTAALIDHLISQYKDLAIKNATLTMKQKRAEVRIAELNKEAQKEEKAA